MKIVVISDTHYPVQTASLPDVLYKEFSSCDIIVHAGDIVENELLVELESIAEVKAVAGNMDSFYLKNRLPAKLLFEAGGFKIGVVHGSGDSKRVPEKVKSCFMDDLPDVIIFGHSHIAYNKKSGDTLLFNPGSVSDRVFAPYRSYGLLLIENGKIDAQIIKI